VSKKTGAASLIADSKSKKHIQTGFTGSTGFGCVVFPEGSDTIHRLRREGIGVLPRSGGASSRSLPESGKEIL
jgi:hypothetical protein